MKKVRQIVFTAATLVALSGLAYSENTDNSIDEQVGTSTSTDDNMNSSAGDATGSETDMGMENPPSSGGEVERGDSPGGSSPGGMMDNYSSTTNGDSSMPTSGGFEETNP